MNGSDLFDSGRSASPDLIEQPSSGFNSTKVWPKVHHSLRKERSHKQQLQHLSDGKHPHRIEPLTFRDNVSGILVSYITVLFSISAPEVNNQQIDISNVEMRIHNCKASTKFTSIEQNKSHVQVFCRIPKGLCFHQPRFIQFWTETQISPQMLFQTRTHTEYHYYFPFMTACKKIIKKLGTVHRVPSPKFYRKSTGERNKEQRRSKQKLKLKESSTKHQNSISTLRAFQDLFC